VREIIITVAEAANNLADCVNRAHDEHITFVLIQNGSPVARLVPDSERICIGRDLAKVMGEAGLSNDDATAWRRDLKAVRETLKLPAHKWR